MIKLCTIWMIGSLISANRQTLVEQHMPRVLYEVCLNTYEITGGTITAQSIVYDSLVITRDSNIQYMHYYLNGFDEVQELVFDTGDTFDLGISKPLPSITHVQTWYERVQVDPVNFPVLVREFSSCLDPSCFAKHGHIQYTAKSWYSPEFGQLVTTGGTSWRNARVTLLMGYKNNVLAGKLVHRLMNHYFKKDILLFQKYTADYSLYYGEQNLP